MCAEIGAGLPGLREASVGEVVRGDGLEMVTDDQTGQFVERVDLTPKQARLCHALADGLPNRAAGIAAGYKSPDVTVSRLKANPAIRARVFELRQLKLERLASLALPRLEAMLKDAKTPAGVLLQAIQFTLREAGHVRTDEKPSKDKPLSELTLAELERLKAAHDALEVVGKSQTIDQSSSQVTDIIVDG